MKGDISAAKEELGSNPYLVDHSQLPSWAQDNAWIVKGYRRPGGTHQEERLKSFDHGSVYKCWKSVWAYWHNETGKSLAQEHKILTLRKYANAKSILILFAMSLQSTFTRTCGERSFRSGYQQVIFCSTSICYPATSVLCHTIRSSTRPVSLSPLSQAKFFVLHPLHIPRQPLHINISHLLPHRP